MKKPLWLPLIPVPLPPDIFGLRHLSLLEEACESEAEKQKRVATAKEGFVAAFKALVKHSGEDESRRFSARVMRRLKRGQGKTHVLDRDAILLEEYDAAARTGETIPALAKRLHGQRERQLGSTAGAIAAQIRRVVKDRERRSRAGAARTRRHLMATRDMPPTLLESARSNTEGGDK